MNGNHRDPDSGELDEARLTAYALGQLDEKERAEVEARLAASDQARRIVDETRALAEHLTEANRRGPAPLPSPVLREAVQQRLHNIKWEDSPMKPKPEPSPARKPGRNWRAWGVTLLVACCLLLAAMPFWLPAVRSALRSDRGELARAVSKQNDAGDSAVAADAGDPKSADDAAAHYYLARNPSEDYKAVTGPGRNEEKSGSGDAGIAARPQQGPGREIVGDPTADLWGNQPAAVIVDGAGIDPGFSKGGAYGVEWKPTEPAATSLAGTTTAPVRYPTTRSVSSGTLSTGPASVNGPAAPSEYAPTAPATGHPVVASVKPSAPVQVAVQNPQQGDGEQGFATFDMKPFGEVPGGQPQSGNEQGAGQQGAGQQGQNVLGEVPGGQPQSGSEQSAGQQSQQPGGQPPVPNDRFGETVRNDGRKPTLSTYTDLYGTLQPRGAKPPDQVALHETPLTVSDLGREEVLLPTVPGTEQYDAIVENPFVRAVGKKAVSTFSVDVDTASYTNVRRFLNEGRLPPPDAVRIEEMVNYFSYDYPLPEGDVPFAVHMEVAQCPWNTDHRLLRIGIKGQEIDREERGPSNLVFLLDVSGSMRDENKLALVKKGMKLLAKQLGEDDRVAIVTYASGTEVKLQSTGGHERDMILGAIDSLSAGGSTHGSAGIQLAYQQAAKHFVSEGTNRVILCTDGDLNVGITQDDELVKLIREKATSGVFLTVLGFGTGNLKDAKMEKLADHGNGVYAYIDGVTEAHKVLVEQMTGSLITIAKDVKLQIEFNPAEVHSYRLIGYENRVLAARDFDDDKKDAGEIGAGHTVTALYEIVPAGEQGASGPGGEGLKYQRTPPTDLTEQAATGELATLALRYKLPDADKSTRLEFFVEDSDKRFGQASTDFRFASAVASFGMALRHSRHRGSATLSAVEEYAAGAIGEDPGNYRHEFVDLVRRARQLMP